AVDMHPFRIGAEIGLQNEAAHAALADVNGCIGCGIEFRPVPHHSLLRGQTIGNRGFDNLSTARGVAHMERGEDGRQAVEGGGITPGREGGHFRAFAGARLTLVKTEMSPDEDLRPGILLTNGIAAISRNLQAYELGIFGRKIVWVRAQLCELAVVIIADENVGGGDESGKLLLALERYDVLAALPDPFGQFPS